VTNEAPLELGRPSENSQPFTVGIPDLSGETLTLREAEERGFGSASTLKKLALKGKLPGATKLPGPNGVEWRVPLASLEVAKVTVETTSGRPKPTEEIESLRKQIEAEREARVRAEEDLARERQTREELSRTVQVLTGAIENLSRAIGPGTTEKVEKPEEKESSSRWWQRSKKQGSTTP